MWGGRLCVLIPIRVMWKFSTLTGFYPGMQVLWVQSSGWGWGYTTELFPLLKCILEGVSDGFCLLCEDLGGGRPDNSFPTCAFFFFKWRSAHAHQIPFFGGQDQSTVAQQAETTVAKCFLTSCVWARLSWQVLTLCLESIVSLLWLCWVRGVCMFRCSMLPAFFAE